MVDIQEIKLRPKESAYANANWSDCKKHADEVEVLGLEVEDLLNQLAKKFKALNEKAILAFKEAPSTDCGYGVSPISQVRFTYAIKMHLIKYGMRVDNYHYGDEDRLLDFTRVVSDGVKWLLKFSK